MTLKMKLQHYLIGLLLLVGNTLYAQRITTLVLEDAAGLRDTVYFGQQNGATPGIDPALGEVDISSVPMGLSELRFASKAPISCFWLNNVAYQNHTYETKEDYRGLLMGGRIDFTQPNYGQSLIDMEENMFHLKVKCTALPCTLRSISPGPWPTVTSIFRANTYSTLTWNTDCSRGGTSGVNGILSRVVFPGFLAVVRSNPNNPVQDTTFYLSLYLDPGTTFLPRSLSSLNLRLINNELVVSDGVLTPSHITIVDMVGRERFQQDWPQGEQQLALPPLHGLYMLRLRYPDGSGVVVRQLFGD